MMIKNTIRQLLMQNRAAEAMVHCKKLTTDYPEDAEAWFLLSSVQALADKLCDAENSCRTALKFQPNAVPALYNLGIILQRQGRHTEACAVFRLAMPLSNDDPALRHEYANSLLSSNDISGAISIYRLLLQDHPEMVDARCNLALAYFRQGDTESAADEYTQVLATCPNHAVALHKLGALKVRQGEFEGAVPVLQQAMANAPDIADIAFQLGLAYQGCGRPDVAVGAFERAGILDPKNAEPHYRAGLLLRQHARITAARDAFCRALRILPTHSKLWLQMGHTLQALGEFADAATAYEYTLELDNEDIDARTGLAAALNFLGEYDSAFAVIAPLVEAGCKNPNVAVTFATISAQCNRQQAAKELLKQVINEPGLEKDERLKIHFELARLLDESQQFKEAFFHYAAGNQLVGIQFSQEAHHSLIDRMIATFTRASIVQLRHAENQSQVPLFIVGMPRSGTSLVEQMLATHPRVFGAGELEAINDSLVKVGLNDCRHTAYPLNLLHVQAELLEKLALRHLALLSRLSGGADLVTDKMPGNFLHLGFISMLFPRARIIHCVRNPIDTCLSCYFHYFTGHHPYAYDLADLGLYYREYRRLMDHWKRIDILPILDVHYEHLVSNPKPIIREMLGFCGLDWKEECLDFHASKRIARTASVQQVRKPLYTSSVNRWEHYRAHIEPLLAALGTALSTEAGA